MGRKRAQQIVARLARHFPERHACATRETERIEREARRGGENSARLVECCAALLRELTAFTPLLPFVAQGCPSCLSAVLGRVSCPADGCADASRVMLRLAYMFLTSGAPVDALMDNIGKNFASFLALLFFHDAEVVQMAASLFFWAAHLAPDGEIIAVRLLGSDDFWRRWDEVYFGDKLQALDASSLLSLVACIRMLRACCGVTSVGRDAVILRLEQFCTVAEVRDETLQLIVVLRLTSADTSGVVNKCYTALIASGHHNDSCEETQTFSEACAVSDENNIPVTALCAALNSLQKNQFDSAARLKDLHSVARLLFPQPAPSGVAAALLTFLPGALKAVFAAASGVDENVSACACTILASAIGEVELLAAATQQREEQRRCYRGFDPLHYQKSLVEHFFLLGGVVLLEDLLTDYSNSVVVAALQLLQALLRFSEDSRNVILASRCLEYLRNVLKSISHDSNFSSLRCADGESMVLLALNTVTLLGSDAVRFMSENTLNCISTIATEARSNAKVLKAAIRALTLLAEAHPMAATLVLDYEFINTVLSLDEGMRPSELDAVYLVGYFKIMAAIVSRQSSSVNFEWIETVALASRRAEDWAEGVPDYAFALWELFLKTVLASEDGSAYLFDDGVVVDVLLNALTRCCRLLLPKEGGYGGEVVSVSGDAGGNNDNDAHEAKSGEYVKLLPLLVLVARRSPLALSRQLPVDTPYLLEAVAFLVENRKDVVSPVLFVDVALYVAVGDDTAFSSAVAILADAGSLVVPVLLKRLQSFFLNRLENLSTIEGDNSLNVFSFLLALLSGVLKLSEESRNCATLDAVANLVVTALKSLDICLLPFSFYACMLQLLCGLMPVDDDDVGEVARRLWLEDNILELLSSFLHLMRYHEGDQEVRDAVYDTVRWLFDTQNGMSLSLFLRDQALFLFVVEHVSRNCVEVSCRSLFMSLCAHSSFRRYFVDSYRELYCVDLGNLSENDGNENINVLATLISQCGEGLMVIKDDKKEKIEEDN